MDDSASFGRWLRERRRARDLSREELARRVGCAVVTVKKIESSERRPSRQIAELILDVLAVPPEERTAIVRLARATPSPAASALQPPPLSPADLALEDLSGRAIRGYALHQRIGAGGFGVVYRADQPGVGRAVAIKIILPQYANQPDFIRRFEAEAQIIARLEHPHIIPLYDYWREPGGAYLVMRYVPGGTLHSAIQREPLSLDASARLLEQIGAALSAAHRARVIHRDLKPSNILLDSDGNAYLADFGIAKDLGNADLSSQTQAGAIIGSPAYLSPEQIKDEPITPRSDIYSLGILLYELLTGAQPFQAPTPAQLIQKQINEPLPPLRARRPDLPEALDAVIQRATAKNPADRYPDVLALVADFRAVVSSPLSLVRSSEVKDSGQPTTDNGRQTVVIEPPDLANPYKGLRPFTEADAANFFGRDALVAQLLERMVEDQEQRTKDKEQRHDRPLTTGNEQGTMSRFLAVVGPSGSGKSSVVRAGLIPALRRGGVPGSERWFVAELLPGAHPLEELELALLRLAADRPANLAEQLARDERGLLRAARLILPPDDESELLLVIDQFEELFTLVEDEAARAHFLASLVAAATDTRSCIRVVITLRADFYDRPLLYTGLSELVRARTEVILPLTAGELEQAIVKPAQRAGLALEPGLVAAIVKDVGEQPGALPLLQYALTELFERREGRTLTLAAYRESGSVSGALARRADEIYAGLNEQQQEAARQLFLRLISLGEGAVDTRRRVRLAELATTDDRPVTSADADEDRSSVVGGQSSVVELYGRYRLLTFDRDPITRRPTVEIAHEALIRSWGRLREWLDTSRESLRVQRRLAAAAADWLVAGRDVSFLATGARLVQFEVLAEASDLALNAEERAYLEASLAGREAHQAEESARQRRELDLQKRAASRLRYLVGTLTIFLLLAAGLTAFAFNQSKIAQRNAAESRNLALVSGSEAALANGNTDLAITLARQAVMLDPLSTMAQAALSEAAYAPGTIRRFTGHTDSVYQAAISPDGRMVLSTSADKTLILWDIQTGAIIRRFKGHTDAVGSVAFSPDGLTAISGSDDATLILWNIQTGEMIRRFKGHTGMVHAVALSHDGRMVLSASADKTLILWDVQTGEIIRRFQGHTDEVNAVAISPDGRTALSGSRDKTLILWDLQTSQIIRRYTGDIDPVKSVAISPDGRTAISGTEGPAVLWDIATGQIIRRFARGHQGEVLRVAFSPDGRYVLTGSPDTTMALWDVATGEVISHFRGHASAVNSVAFTPDGYYALSSSADGTLRLWDLGTGQTIRHFKTRPATGYVAFSPDGRRVLIASYEGMLILSDAQTGQELRRFSAGDALHEARFSPDGHAAILALGDEFSTNPGAAILWDVETGREIRRFGGHSSGVDAVAFSPDGRSVVSCSGDGTIILWDVATGQEIRQFVGHHAIVDDAVFSPDGQMLLSGGFDGTIILWDVKTGREIRRFVGHTWIVTNVVFTSDGRTALSSSWDGNVIVWDVATGAILRRLPGHSAASFYVSLSPDGRTAFAGSADNTAILWDITTGIILRRYPGPNAGAYSSAFSPDGRDVAVGFFDGRVELWRIDSTPDDLLAWTHANRFVPELTCDQRALYRLESLCPENTATPAGVATPASR